MAQPVEAYLNDLIEVRRSGAGTKETSYYGALCSLLNTIGKELKPRVHCIVQLANQGSGHPDLGLFTTDQFQRGSDAEPLPGQKPSRGVIEAKASSADVRTTGRSPQVEKYLSSYGVVLVTNFRDFLVVGRDPITGATTELESFSLAADETTFWREAAHPRKMAKAIGARLTDFLRRALLQTAPLTLPSDVAWFLASYAREALARVEAADLPALDAVRAALESSLGIRFADEKGEHFFRSTLVQTIFYGVFSSWILWSKEQGPTSRESFRWREAAYYLRVPMISQLFEQVATPSRLQPLGLVEVLNWTATALNRIDRAAFFERFREEHAVQYFYEPFLQAFDPSLRKELGVWYTPPEVVKYMVGRVDQALRRDLGIASGLADPRVHVLDPCAGTGAYLVEVLEKIAETLHENSGGSMLDKAMVREAAKKRLHGFELLPAPFVVSHLQLGLVLQRLGVPLAEGDRVGVYLTNALTGWQPPTEEGKRRLAQLELPLPGLREEREAAESVKRDAPILVILGNPPYNGFAGVAMDEERDLSDAYRKTKKAPKPQGQGLNDLYVRFFRMAERKIVEETGRGVVCFISNYSWLDGLSFTGMREKYLEVFDRVTVDCLNGDKYKTGKVTPEGEPDPSVFSTEWNREGIQVGTAVATLVKYGNEPFRLAFWLKSKKIVTEDMIGRMVQEFGSSMLHTAELLRIEWHENDLFLVVTPRVWANSYFNDRMSAYLKLFELPWDVFIMPNKTESAEELVNTLKRRAGKEVECQVYVPQARGTVLFRHFWGRTKREELVTSLDDGTSYEVVEPPLTLGLPFFPTATEGKFLEWPVLPELFPIALPGVQTKRDEFVVSFNKEELENRLKDYFNTAVSDEEIARRYPRAMEKTQRFDPHAVRRHLIARGCLYGHIVRYVYRPLDLRYIYWEPETKLLGEKSPDYFPQVFPGNIWIEARQKQPKAVFDRGYVCSALADNFGNGFSSFFPLLIIQATVGDDLFEQPAMSEPKPNISDEAAAYLSSIDSDHEALFFHTIATLHAPRYKEQNAGALRQDWPRVPLPRTKALLDASDKLGREVAALLDPESVIPGVTEGTIRRELRHFGVLTLPEGHPLNEAEDFAITARWGYAGRGGITMPARGDLRDNEKGVPKELQPLLGEKSYDIMLNGNARWANVPERVWEYTLGGYQVIKKWLSYREMELLGRPLRLEEVRHVEHMIRRITALLLLAPQLDENYEAVKGNTYPWPGKPSQ